MEDDWGNEEPVFTPKENSSSGCAFSTGRGKRPYSNDLNNQPHTNGGSGENGDVWGASSSKATNDDAWDNNGDDFSGGGGDGHNRRGGRGGGGFRGGRGGGRRFENGDGGGDRRDFGERRGRNEDRDEAGQDGAPDKPPKSTYVPPDADEDYIGISTGINFEKYSNIEVNTSGENVPAPIRSFEESGLRPSLIENVAKAGYKKLTPIQKYSIPIVREGRDLMACAQTGSGKTAAFLLPIIHKLLEDPQDLIVESDYISPQCVVVAPTRELAIQIRDQALKYAKGLAIKIQILYGGTSVMHQRQNIMRGCHILVATVGRLDDFVNRGYIKFDSTRFVVLDEADRMLDMGFKPQVEGLMNNSTMPPVGSKQALMFSATFPDEVQRIAGDLLSNYILVAVGIIGGACSDVEQNFIQAGKFEKRTKLFEILDAGDIEGTMIFTETKRNADFLALTIAEKGYPTTSIHGDRLQNERETALRDFKTGKCPILVATAVAARGLDIDKVRHVINYDMPKEIDEYVHRIGRTGRLGNNGKATSLFDADQDTNLASGLIRILKQANQPIPSWLKDGGYSAPSSGFNVVDIRGDGFGAAQDTPLQAEDEEW